MTDAIMEQDSGSGFRRLVPGWDSLSISGKVICNDQYVLIATSGHLKRQKIHTDKVHRICGVNNH